jgi:hypothetical protein
MARSLAISVGGVILVCALALPVSAMAQDAGSSPDDSDSEETSAEQPAPNTEESTSESVDPAPEDGAPRGDEQPAPETEDPAPLAPEAEEPPPEEEEAAPSDEASGDEAPCAQPSTSTDLVRALGTAEAYFSSLNAEMFRVSVDESEALVPCMNEALSMHLAGEFHRFQGIRAFVDRDPGLSTRSFAAARSIEPDYTFPEFLIPKGNPILQEYTAVDPSMGETEDMPAPKHGYFQFDGQMGNVRPKSWPTLVQHFDKKGAVMRTVYLRPGDPFFEYEVPRPPILNVPLFVAANGALLVSAVLALASAGLRYDYNHPATQHSELESLRKKTNNLSVASGVFFVTSAGLGATSFIVVRL